MVDKLCVVIDPIKFGKVHDASLKKPAAEALEGAVGKALSGKAKVLGKADKDTDGLRLTLTLAELLYDAAKSELSASVKGVIARLPEDKYLAGLSSNGKVPNADANKLAREAAALLEGIGENLAATVIKSLAKL